MSSGERINISLKGGAPWGFRLSGGGVQPLTIVKIRNRSHAHEQGLQEGDAVISINGVHVHDKSQSEALELVEKSGDSLALEIFRGSVDELSGGKQKRLTHISDADNDEFRPVSQVTGSDSDVSQGEVILTSSSENTKSDSCGFTETSLDQGGFTLTATVDDVSNTAFPEADAPSSPVFGFTITATVDEITSTDTAKLNTSHVISADFLMEDVQSISTLSSVTAASIMSSPTLSDATVDTSSTLSDVTAATSSTPSDVTVATYTTDSDVTVNTSSTPSDATVDTPTIESDVKVSTSSTPSDVTVDISTIDSDVTDNTSTTPSDVPVATSTIESDVNVNTSTTPSDVTVDISSTPSDVTVLTSTIESDATVGTSTIETDVTVDTPTIESDATVDTPTIESDVTVDTSSTPSDVTVVTSTIESDVKVDTSTIESDVKVDTSTIESDVKVDTSTTESDVTITTSTIDVTPTTPFDVTVDTSTIESDVTVNTSSTPSDATVVTSTVESDATVDTSTVESDVTFDTSTITSDVTVDTSTITSDVTVNTSTIESDVTVNTSTIESDITIATSAIDVTSTTPSDVTVATSSRPPAVTVNTSTTPTDVTVLTSTTPSDVTVDTPKTQPDSTVTTSSTLSELTSILTSSTKFDNTQITSDDAIITSSSPSAVTSLLTFSTPPDVPYIMKSTTYNDSSVQVVQQVHQSNDGSRTPLVHNRITSISTTRSPVVQNQIFSFSVVQPTDATQAYTLPMTTSTTTAKTFIVLKSPSHFSESVFTNIPQTQLQTSTVTSNSNTGNLSSQASRTRFRPTNFVPVSRSKTTSGLYTLASPEVADKKRIQKPLFQVTNVISDMGSQIWRPNMWLPRQDEQRVAPPVSSFSVNSSFLASKPSYSWIEDDRMKARAHKISATEYEEMYRLENQEPNDIQEHHHRQERLHVFAPPVEFHVDSGCQDGIYGQYDDYHYTGQYDDGLSSPDSFGTRRRRNLYSDSAFYDTPGKSYPTVTEQVKLSKKITQSLTSATNRGSRGARMFMKRSHTPMKLVRDGLCELFPTSDVSNLPDLGSDVSSDEDQNKPVLYFKVPDLKRRIGKNVKETKKALTPEQFEKLRLNSKKCEHLAVTPELCFDIVADLKAHRGRGGRLFERRRQRSDKFIVDEKTSRLSALSKKPTNVSSQPPRHEITPWEAALRQDGNVDATFSHLSEFGRNQINQTINNTKPIPQTRSSVGYSLKPDKSRHLLKGPNFNRAAKGWTGGGEYPIAERLHHIAHTRQPSPSAPVESVSPQQNFNTTLKEWEARGESPYASSSAQDWSHDQLVGRKLNNKQAQRQDEFSRSTWAEHAHADYGGWGSDALQVPRSKSWHSESYDAPRSGTQTDYTYSNSWSGGYPNVAYKQPIIPGTDL